MKQFLKGFYLYTGYNTCMGFALGRNLNILKLHTVGLNNPIVSENDIIACQFRNINSTQLK